MRVAVVLAILFAATTARADDVLAPAEKTRATNEERPFVHVLDPTTPSAGFVSLGYGFGLGSGVAAERPLPANVASAGASHHATVSFGATDRIAPFLGATADSSGATPTAGARFQITDPASPFRLTFAAAFFREGRGGAFGASTRAAASYDVGALRVAGNLHVERAFARARDTVDVLALAGASYKVAPMFRLGAEYVGQDLEDAIENEEAEGGARHFLGPTGALDLQAGKLQLTFGPAFGLNERSPRFLGRIAVLASF
jgi:hypothetical protein